MFFRKMEGENAWSPSTSRWSEPISFRSCPLYKSYTGFSECNYFSNPALQGSPSETFEPCSQREVHTVSMYATGGTQMSLFGFVKTIPENNHLDICALYHVYASPTTIKTIENSDLQRKNQLLQDQKSKKHLNTRSQHVGGNPIEVEKSLVGRVPHCKVFCIFSIK